MVKLKVKSIGGTRYLEEMRTLTLIVIASLGLFGCNIDSHFREAEDLIQNQIRSTEDILADLNDFTKRHGREGLDIEYMAVGDFTAIHKKGRL